MLAGAAVGRTALPTRAGRRRGPALDGRSLFRLQDGIVERAGPWTGLGRAERSAITVERIHAYVSAIQRRSHLERPRILSSLCLFFFPRHGIALGLPGRAGVDPRLDGER